MQKSNMPIRVKARANPVLDIINQLYEDEKYTEALSLLRLLRKGIQEQEGKRMIDQLIRICLHSLCEQKLNATSSK